MSNVLSDKRLTIEIVNVTPKLATQWLERNTHNRRLDKNTVRKYVRDILNGDWMLNGETIIRSKSGVLQNGQHRLEAIKESGETVPLIVVTLATDDEMVLATIDTGKPRTNADVLSIQGVPNSSRVAAIGRWVSILDSGRMEGSQALSAGMLAAVREAHPLIDHYATLQASGGSKLVLSCMMAPAVLAAEAHGTELVDVFVKNVMSGENLASTDPAFQVRKRIIDATGANTRMTTGAKVGSMIRGLKAHIAGDTLRGGFWPYAVVPGKKIF
jgi:hypothetical protein